MRGGLEQYLEEPPSYAELFGNSSGSIKSVECPTRDKIAEKQLDFKSEASVEKAAEVGITDHTACVNVLEQICGRKRAEDHHLTRLATKCQGCQTTARITGAYIAQTKISFRRYIRTIQERSQMNLHSALSLTLEHIKKVNPDAAQLFMFFAYFDSVDLGFELIAAANIKQSTWISRITRDREAYDRTMQWLMNFGLVQYDHLSYGIDPSIHAWLSRSLQQGPLFSTFDLALRCVALGHVREAERDDHLKFDRFMQHAEHLTGPYFENMWRFAMGDFRCIQSVTLLARSCQQRGHVKLLEKLNLAMEGSSDYFPNEKYSFTDTFQNETKLKPTTQSLSQYLSRNTYYSTTASG